VRCVACGSDDRFGYGFCASCGEIHSADAMEAYAVSDREGRQGTAQQLGRNMAIALFFIFMTIVFLAMYLSYLDARWEIVVLVEAFPLFWFLVILMYWRKTREEVNQASDSK
jgi:cbb3-type cytochrome oxidase subunit 3